MALDVWARVDMVWALQSIQSSDRRVHGPVGVGEWYELE